MKKLYGKAICVVALVLVVASVLITLFVNSSSVYAKTTSLKTNSDLLVSATTVATSVEK